MSEKPPTPQPLQGFAGRIEDLQTIIKKRSADGTGKDVSAKQIAEEAAKNYKPVGQKPFKRTPSGT